MTPQCPKCEAALHEVKVEPIKARLNFSDAYKAVVFTCPHCHTILSAAVDWLAFGEDIAHKVAKRLGR